MGTFLGHPAVEFMCVVPAGSGIAMIIQVAPTGQLLDSAGDDKGTTNDLDGDDSCYPLMMI